MEHERDDLIEIINDSRISPVRKELLISIALQDEDDGALGA